MKENYYFSPTAINPSIETNNEKTQNSYDFCTPWQTNDYLKND